MRTAYRSISAVFGSTVAGLAVLVHVVGARQAPAYKDPAVPVAQRVADLMGRMSLDEKIGQMTQADRQFLKSDADIEKYFLGSLLSGGGSTPAVNAPAAWADMYDGYQHHALATPLGIPLIYGIDAVHGHNNVKGATIFRTTSASAARATPHWSSRSGARRPWKWPPRASTGRFRRA